MGSLQVLGAGVQGQRLPAGGPSCAARPADWLLQSGD